MPLLKSYTISRLLFIFKYISHSIKLVILFVSFNASAQPADRFHNPDLKVSEVQFMGYVGDKIKACMLNGIMKTDEAYLVKPFRERIETYQWQSEFWGKYVTSLADAYRYTKDPEMRVKLDQAVDMLLATQSKDGYIGNYTPAARLHQWDIWGMKYCMLGLLDYYEITGSEKTLTALKNLARYVITKVHEKKQPFHLFGNYKGMAAASILEPMVQLYRITNDKAFLEFSNYIVRSWEDKDASQLVTKALQGIPVGSRFAIPRQWYGPDNGQKAYEMMSCYEGLLELYRVTGNQQYLQAVEQAAENIRQTEIMITGSGASMECWFGGAATQSVPVKHTMEACVTVTWMKLCLQLLRTTGEAKWANEIEKSYYNALLGTMLPDGSSWSKYIGVKGKRYLGEDQCGTNLNCCIANGPRGIMLLSKEAFMLADNGIAVNFYAPANARMHMNNNNGEVNLNIATNYPRGGKVIITVDPIKTKQFNLLLRVPEWANDVRLQVNGEAASFNEHNGYAVIKRNWKRGDKVTLLFDMGVRLFSTGTDATHYALLYGPIVLASDKRYQELPFYEFYTPQLKGDTIPYTIATGKKEQVFIEIKIPFVKEVNGLVDKTDELTLVDFASAGNTWDERSAYQVWMQKIRDVSKEK